MKKLNSSLLLKYLDGNCNQDEAEVILSWLDELPDNAEKLFSTEFLLGLLQKERYCRQDELQKAEKRLADTVADRRKAALLQEHGKRRRYLRIVAFAAAVVAIGVMFGLLRSTFRAEEKQITLSVASDEMVKFFLLPDGTRVWLNRSSTLRYPESFSGERRNVVLEGEGYFEVIKNDASPFTVDCNAMRVTVLGTTFNMKSYEGATTVEVSLIEGSVEVCGNHNEGHVVLSPGQRAEIDLATGRISVVAVNTRFDGLWHDNLIPFEEASLDEIAATLEQLYNVHFVISGLLCDKSRYTGVIDKKDSVVSVLRSLTNTIPMSFLIKSNTVYIEPQK